MEPTKVATYDALKSAIGGSAEKIVLTADIDMTGEASITVSRNVTLDLAGKQITKTQAKITQDSDFTDQNRMKIFTVSENSTMEIVDSVGTGKIIGKATQGSTLGKATGDTTLTVNGKNAVLKLTGVTVESDYYGVAIWENSKLVADGATIRSVHASAVGLNGMATEGSKNAMLDINGGTYSSEEGPAFFISNTESFKIAEAVVEGPSALDARAGTIELTDVTIRMNKSVSGSVGTSGPAGLNVAIGVYQWDSSSVGTAYGIPKVTLRNVTVETAQGVTKNCDVYYGSLSAGDSFTDATKANNSKIRAAELTILDGDGKQLFKIDSQSTSAASSVKIDLTSNAGKLGIMKDSVLNCDITAGEGSNKAIFSGIKAASALTIGVGSIVIDGEYTKNESTGSITITGNARVSGTVDAGVTLNVASGAIAVVDTDLVIKGTLNVIGNLVNNGTLDVTADTATQAISGTIVSTMEPPLN